MSLRKWRGARPDSGRNPLQCPPRRRGFVFKQVTGDELRSRTDKRRTTEVAVAVHALDRMLELGRPISVRIA